MPRMGETTTRVRLQSLQVGEHRTMKKNSTWFKDGGTKKTRILKERH